MIQRMTKNSEKNSIKKKFNWKVKFEKYVKL